MTMLSLTLVLLVGFQFRDIEPEEIHIFTVNHNFRGAKIIVTTRTGRNTETFPLDPELWQEFIETGTPLRILNPGRLTRGFSLTISYRDGKRSRFTMTRTGSSLEMDLRLRIFRGRPILELQGTDYWVIPDKYQINRD